MSNLYFLVQLMSLIFSYSSGKVRNEDLNSPECGKVSSRGKPLVIGGESAERAEVPWHAGVYTRTTRPYNQICGGTLISNNIVISAAHCFWSRLESEKQHVADFAVAVGKLYRPWDDDKDNAQKSDVMELHLPPLFQGSMANFQEDIAVVVVTSPFRFTAHVRPACLDFDIAFQNTQLILGNMGKVAGWGLTDVSGTRSQVLKVIDLPFVTAQTCVKDSPLDFRVYITGDKICAGFQNENKAVCEGDSGGGLVFPTWERGAPRFYLRGVVSTAPTSDEQCNVNFYTTFTQVLRHEHFIKQFWKTRELPCKEESLSIYGETPHYSVYNESLQHVTVQRDSAGRLTHFELHVALQADEYVVIWLRDKDHSTICRILVGYERNQYTDLYVGKPTWSTVQRTHTPDILSSTQFRSFYIKVDDGTVQFGKEGDSTTLVSGYIAGLGSLEYFRFSYGGDNTSKIRYDCPHVPESS